MWGEVQNKQQAVQLAIEFTGDHQLYGHYMRRVVSEWPVSCENALTDSALNQRAWVGHAACALAHRLPEDIVRLAWGRLTDEQRVLANAEADRAIRIWKHAYCKSRGLHRDLEGSLL
jgi:hypothetical protein